jgi:hypothetical protein
MMSFKIDIKLKEEFLLKQERLPCREILPLPGKKFFITAESAEIAEKKSRVLRGE